MSRTGPEATTPPRDVLARLGIAMPPLAEHPQVAIARVAGQLLAIVRLGLLPVVALFGAHAPDAGPPFWSLVLAWAGWQAWGLLAPRSFRRFRHPAAISLVVDLGLLSASIAATNGAQSPIAWLFPFLPVIAGFLLTPRRTSAVGAATTVALLAAALPDVVEGEPAAAAATAVALVGLALATTIGVTFALGRRYLTQRAARVDAARRRLLSASLEAEEQERRAASAALHAEALQILLAARQDLEEGALDGEQEPLLAARDGLHEAIAALQRTVRDLHPAALRSTGLLEDAPSGRLPADEHRSSALDDADVERRARRLFAVLRLATVVAVLLAGVVDGTAGVPFFGLVGAAVLLHVTTTAWSFTDRWRSFPHGAGAVVDVVAFAPAIALSGGSDSPVLAIALLLPFLFVLTFAAPQAAALGGLLGLSVLTGTAGEWVPGDGDARADVGTVLLALGWASAASLLLGAGRARLRLRLAHLEQQRRRLLQESLQAADHERRRLADRLLDGPLQVLVLCVQDLEEALTGDGEALARARMEIADGLAQLREAAEDLSPPALDHGGLTAAVSVLVDRARVQTPFAARVDVAEDASGLRDELVVALVRELVANASEHAGARLVSVSVARAGAELLVEVADDGVGMSRGRLAEAVADGRTGLASTRVRVEADGGRMTVESAPDAGTRVRIAVPVAGPPDPGRTG